MSRPGGDRQVKVRNFIIELPYIMKNKGENWKQEAIERDMMATNNKLGKGKNIIISRFYKIKSIGEDKLLKIEMRSELYNLLMKLGINFNDFSKGEKLFEKDKDKFMNIIEMLGGNAEIVDNDFVYETLFDKD